MSYHNKTYNLLGDIPSIDPENQNAVNKFFQCTNVPLPASLAEWYSLRNWDQLIETHALVNHRPIHLHEVTYFHKAVLGSAKLEKYFFFMEENQGVSHWAVLLNGNDDPPVLLRYNDPNEDWHLIAHSFSDWVYALIWDAKVAIENRDFVPLEDESDFAAFASDADEVGPETFCNNTGFWATRFFRVRKGDRLFTCYR